MQDYFFFQNNNENIFAAWHPAQSEAQKGALLFLSAFAEEKNASRRVEYCLAEKLSREGYSVLRFDYRGTGDSAGEFEQYAVTDEISDIRAAWGKLVAMAPEQKRGLLGFRWGANEAFMVCEDLKADFVIAVAPIYDVNRYLKDCLRKNVAAQLGLFGRVVKGTQKLKAELANGTAINYDGFQISAQRYREMINSEYRFPSQSVLLIDQLKAAQTIEKLLSKRDCQNVTPRNIDLPGFWEEKNQYFSELSGFSETVCQWLRDVN